MNGQASRSHDDRLEGAGDRGRDAELIGQTAKRLDISYYLLDNREKQYDLNTWGKTNT